MSAKVPEGRKPESQSNAKANRMTKQKMATKNLGLKLCKEERQTPQYLSA
jgi:hypothetical protein